MKNLTLFLLIIVTFSSCTSTKTSLIVSDSYNEKTKTTTLMLFPYGEIKIPGKWTKTSYNESSKQHHFSNSDSISIAVTMNPKNKYPFHNDSLNNSQWSKEFYKWESDYYRSQGYKTEIIKTNEPDNYLVWKITGNNVNTIFLYGCKRDFAFNYAVFSEMKSEEQRISLLINLFEKNYLNSTTFSE